MSKSIQDELMEDEDFNTEIFKENDLMESIEPSPRIFMKADSNHTSLLGFVLSETPDSFLVALPSKLVEVDGVKKVDTYINVPYIRIMKSSLFSVMHPFGDFKKYFDEYLKGPGPERYPEISEEIELYLMSEDPEGMVTQEEMEAFERKAEEISSQLEEAEGKGGAMPYKNTTKH